MSSAASTDRARAAEILAASSRLLSTATSPRQLLTIADLAASCERRRLGDVVTITARALRLDALARLGVLLERTVPPMICDRRTATLARQLAALAPGQRRAIAARELTLAEAVRRRGSHKQSRPTRAIRNLSRRRDRVGRTTTTGACS